MKLRKVCAWCFAGKESGDGPISHTICWRCEVESEFKSAPLYLKAAYWIERFVALLGLAILFIFAPLIGLARFLKGPQVPTKRPEGNEGDFQ